MRCLAGAIMLSLALGLAGRAGATPPDVIDVSDEVFGFSQDSIVLLRSLRDNLGLYTAERRYAFLVTVDRASGAESLQPVCQIYRHEDTDQAGNAPGVLSWASHDETPDDAVNPWDVLAAAGGSPFRPGGFQDIEAAGLSGSLAAGAIRISAESGSNAAWSGEGAVLLTGAGARLDAVADRLGDMPRMGPLRAGDLLRDQAFGPESCTIADVLIFGGIAGGMTGGEPSAMLRMDCGDAEEGLAASLLVAVPMGWRGAIAP
ncbi:hypothetical protein HOY34_09105 [Xinfangfangia sp. D13-10-4-6]|uniref:hypothetical protein n=1 Tax=Pseudogemmobacter hezensis TaxID=2737662 RepID=UPI001555DF43|nr:hypothetical protein [Pseudogemmobacter hezensis]NPD15355.1 hypothetical protein [Pseudogemmobacter hezensis]